MRRAGGQAFRRTEGRISAVAWSARPAVRLSVAFLVSCTPVTTPPHFLPHPRGLAIILAPRRGRVPAVLDSLVPAERLVVAHSNVRDGYVETGWYDTQAHRTRRHERDITSLGATVKIRFWADPWV